VTITTNIERTARTALEMAEAQRDFYEALAENVAAIQRRNAGLAQDGLKFFRLQEDNARAAQEWFANGIKLLQLQKRNAEFAQKWFSGGVDALRDQTEYTRRTAEVFARSARKQQEGFRTLTQTWAGAYKDFLSPFAYAQEGLRSAQDATQQVLETTREVAQQGLRVAEETTEQTEEILRRTEEATREAELRVAVLSALKTEDYEELTVAELAKKLDDLSAEELKQVREYEKRNKDRETLVEQIDRKIRVKS
jgi:hypothetical protein